MQMHHSLTSPPVQHAYAAHFSDSILDEQDPLEKLIPYFFWLVARSPMQSAALIIAKETLIEEGNTFKTLDKLLQAELEKTGIKPGIAMQYDKTGFGAVNPTDLTILNKTHQST